MVVASRRPVLNRALIFIVLSIVALIGQFPARAGPAALRSADCRWASRRRHRRSPCGGLTLRSRRGPSPKLTRLPSSMHARSLTPPGSSSRRASSTSTPTPTTSSITRAPRTSSHGRHDHRRRQLRVVRTRCREGADRDRTGWCLGELRHAHRPQHGSSRGDGDSETQPSIPELDKMKALVWRPMAGGAVIPDGPPVRAGHLRTCVGDHRAGTHRQRTSRRAPEDFCVRESEGLSLARVQAAEECSETGGGGGGLRMGDLASVPPHSFVTPERSEGAGQDRQEQLGHASISTTLTSTLTSSMPRIARRWRQSKSGCLSNWTQMVPNWRSSANGSARKCAEGLNLGLEAPPGFEPGMEVLQIKRESLSC